MSASDKPATHASARTKPLAGIRVLDLTRLLPGPMCTLHLADMGADVIKIEDTGAGDYARAMGPMAGESSAFYRLLNRNKRALRLDLKQPAGRDVLHRLVVRADVLVEGFRPGVMDKLGAGYAALSAINPRLVYCSITGYGQDGPWRDRAGHDINYIATAGVLEQSGAEGGPPVVPNFQIGDLLGGALTPAMGILAALVDARTSGRGRHVDVAMTDAVFAHAVFPLLAHLGAGSASARGAGMLSGGLPCYNVYRTADDRYMAVGALEQKFWELLCDALGCADLKPLHIVYGEAAAPARQRLAKIFATRTQAEWTAHFSAIDCCVTPVLDMAGAQSNEQLLARGMVAASGGFAQFASPVKFSEDRFSVHRDAPAAGADSESILGEAGYSAADIAAFKRKGVI